MGRRKGGYPPQRSHRQMNLERIRDTSDTIHSTKGEGEGSADYRHSESIPPPFKGIEQGQFITKSDLGLTWKTGAIISSVFLAIGVPVIWFAASLNSNVDNLQKDMTDVKDKTQTLIERSIKQDGRLNSLDRSIADLKSQLVSTTPNSTSNETVNKTIQRHTK